MESKGTPTDRLKTEAEVAKIEKDRLDRLEVFRLSLPTSWRSRQLPIIEIDLCLFAFILIFVAKY